MSEPSFPCSLKTRKGIHATLLVLKLWCLYLCEVGKAERVGPGWYHWMPPAELAKEELYCNGTWILILTPLLPGCVTSASLLCSLSLGWCM